MRDMQEVKREGDMEVVGLGEGPAGPASTPNPLDDEEIIGGNLMGWCRVCKGNSEHTIVIEGDESDEQDDDAVQVGLCTDCGDEHSMEAPRTTRRRGKHRTVKQDDQGLVSPTDLVSPESIRAAWERLTSAVDGESAPVYSPSLLLRVSNMVRHTRFGLGVVFAVHSPTKVEVLFADKQRKLVCAR